MMFFWRVFTALVLVSLLGACATTEDPYHHEVKRTAYNNDYEQAFALVDRPLPADLVFMNNYIESRKRQFGYVNYVAITGSKEETNVPLKSSPFLIAATRDKNSIALTSAE